MTNDDNIFDKNNNFGNFEKIEKTGKDISGFLNIDDDYVKNLLEEIENLKNEKINLEDKLIEFQNQVFNKKKSILEELNKFSKTKNDFQDSFFTNPSIKNSIA